MGQGGGEDWQNFRRMGGPPSPPRKKTLTIQIHKSSGGVEGRLRADRGAPLRNQARASFARHAIHEDKHRLNSPTEGILTTAKVFTYLNLPQNAMKPLFCPQIVGKFRETFQRAYSLPPITTKNDEFDAKSWVPDLIEAPSRFTWPLIWIGPNYFSDVQSFSKLFYAFIYQLC